MHLRQPLLLSLSLLSLAPAALADDKPYFSNKTWSIYQGDSNGHFWECDIARSQWDNNYLLTIVEAMDGYLSLSVSGISNLIDNGDTVTSGQLQIDNGKFIPFNKMGVYDSSAKPGEKYVSIDVDFDLRDQLAKARTLTVSLPKGNAKFPLAGASEALDKLGPCLDDGISQERTSSSTDKTYRPPSGWSSSIDGAVGGAIYFSNENPAGGGAFALVQGKDGNYALRLRDTKADVGTALDSSTAKREAATIDFGSGAASFVTFRKDNAVDITGLTAADLGKLPVSGLIKITSLEPGANFSHSYPVAVNLAAAAKALLMPSGGDAPASADSIAGKYYVRGHNSDGKTYTGDAEVTADGDNVKVTYTWGSGKTVNAKGAIFENVLTTIGEGDTNPMVYKIGKDRVWRGAFLGSSSMEYAVPKAN